MVLSSSASATSGGGGGGGDKLLKNGKSVTVLERNESGDSAADLKLVEKELYEDDETSKPQWKLVPPDGGWGWLVLVGSTMVNVLVPGTVKSFGILFVEFLEVFDASPAAAAWIPALCYFLYSSLGPVSSILSLRYSYRTVTLLGGSFAAFGMMLSFFATNVPFLYISYGVLVGTGAGLSFPPTVYIVTSYFQRLRGVANGICISGSALGSIILPPVLRVLLNAYGYRGAVLLMGAITLNVWVAALFYHPVERHMRRVPATDSDAEAEANGEDDGECYVSDRAQQQHTIMDCITEGGGSGGGSNADGDEDAPLKPKFVIDADNLSSVGANLHVAAGSPLPPPDNSDITQNSFIRSVSSAAVPNYWGTGSGRERKISMPLRADMHRVRSGAAVANMASTGTGLNVVLECTGSESQKLMANGAGGAHARVPSTRRRPTSSSMTPKRSPSTSSFQYISTPYHGSTLTLQPEIFASSFSLRGATDKSAAGGAVTSSKAKTARSAPSAPAKKFIDLSLLSDPLYLIILISNSTNAIGYTNFIILLPSYVLALGYDKDAGAMLLSIVSALDLVGRIGGSALSDLQLIPKSYYFIGGLFVSGVSLAVMPMFTNALAALIACCALFGLASGIYVGVTAVLMADMLGTERLQSTYGISLFVNGILQLIGPPICGVWIEHTRSFVSLFTWLGIVLVTGACIWGFVPFVRRPKQHAARKYNQEGDDDDCTA